MRTGVGEGYENGKLGKKALEFYETGAALSYKVASYNLGQHNYVGDFDGVDCSKAMELWGLLTAATNSGDRWGGYDDEADIIAHLFPTLDGIQHWFAADRAPRAPVGPESAGQKTRTVF